MAMIGTKDATSDIWMTYGYRSEITWIPMNETNGKMLTYWVYRTNGSSGDLLNVR